LQAPEDASRVLRLRGCAFWGSIKGVRCACRNRSDALGVNDGIGFRVVLAVPP